MSLASRGRSYTWKALLGSKLCCSSQRAVYVGKPWTGHLMRCFDDAYTKHLWFEQDTVTMTLHTFLCQIVLETWNLLLVGRGSIGMMLGMAGKVFHGSTWKFFGDVFPFYFSICFAFKGFSWNECRQGFWNQDISALNSCILVVTSRSTGQGQAQSKHGHEHWLHHRFHSVHEASAPMITYFEAEPAEVVNSGTVRWVDSWPFSRPTTT